MQEPIKILVNTPSSGFKAYNLKKSHVYVLLGLGLAFAGLSVLSFTAFWYQKNRVRSLETELSLIQTAQHAAAAIPSSEPEANTSESSTDADNAADNDEGTEDSPSSAATVENKQEAAAKAEPAVETATATAAAVVTATAEPTKTLPGTRRYLSSLWQDISAQESAAYLSSSPLQINVLKFFTQNGKAKISLSVNAKKPGDEPYRGYLMYFWTAKNSFYFEPQNIFWENKQLVWDYRLAQSYTIKRVKLVDLEFPIGSSNPQQLVLLIVGFDSKGKVHYVEQKDWKSLSSRVGP